MLAVSYLGCAVLLCSAIAPTQESDKNSGTKVSPIVGKWNSINRHVALGSLFQPVHGVRKREAVIQFQQDSGRLTGFAETPDYREIVSQKNWKDGRTEFRNVTFAGNRLAFEFDIAYSKDNGPLAVEAGLVENKGHVRVDAQLKEVRLVGTWKMFLKDGMEVFRGEWEAERAKQVEPPQKPLESSFKVGEKLPLTWEHRLNGPRAGQDGSLVCTYYYQPFVAIYCREINAHVGRLVAKVEEATAQHNTRTIPGVSARLGSYVVLFGHGKDRATELTDLAKKAKIERTILSLLVNGDASRLGEAQTTVLLVVPRAIVKASYAYRPGELKAEDIDRIVREIPKLLLNQN